MDERIRSESILRDSESRHAFLVALDAALRPLADPVDIQATASRILGQHLGVNRVAYFDVRDDYYVIEQDYVSGVASMVGRYPIGSFSRRVLEAYRRGRIVVNEDIARDLSMPESERALHASLQIGAYIVVPLMKNGRFVVGLGVHSRSPRSWSEDEIGLVEETAERMWSSVLRARAESALAESEARYRTLFSQIDEGFCVAELLYDEEGRACDRRLLEANPRYHELVGRQFAVGSTARAQLPNVDNFWFDVCHQVVTTGLPVRFEHQVPHLGRWYDVYLSRVGGQGSRLYAAVFRETTERRRREANLEFLSEVGRDLVALQGLNEAMQVLGTRIARHMAIDGCTLAKVDDAHGLLTVEYEWRREGVPSIRGEHRIAGFVDEAARAQLRSGREVTTADVDDDPAMNGAEFGQLGIRAFVCVPVIADGAWRFALVVFCTRPRRWRNDEVDVLRELAERMWSRLELARVDQELREADRRKDEFLATLGHELRNPLAPIRNGLHYFRRQCALGPQAAQMHGMMERQFSHLVRLVDDLLEVSRITRGKVELRLERVALDTIIQGAIETSRPLLDEHGHSLEVDLHPEPLQLEADSVRLMQVFANLLNNAAKYTPDNGRIRISTQRAGREAVISVRDNGVGIPAAMLGNIFELFTQVDGNRGQAQGGLGIGLTLVRSIVNLHGGRVTARSAGPGCGSEFVVTLPLSDPD